jgi:hypothetical protein
LSTASRIPNFIFTGASVDADQRSIEGLSQRTAMIRKLPICIGLFLALLTAHSALAADRPQPPVPSRITSVVDDNVRVTLKGNVHPLAQARFDKGAVPDSTPASRLTLILKPSPTQNQALREYLDELQDKNSPNYHKWLSPEQFGSRYGAADQDIEAISQWLRSHGFTVNRVAKARNLVEFSGTAGQVQDAFHTAIHRYVVNGEEHYANATNPEIPAALSPVVAGVTQLHNFNPKSNSILGKHAHWNADKSGVGKQITWVDPYGDNALYMVPSDAAILYNTPNAQLNPSFTGKTYDGAGVTVGIAGDANFTMQDVANYRAFFLNDKSSAHLPNVIIDGNDPGLNSDSGEALLDNEILGGIAPAAKINFYTAQNNNLQSGLFLAIYRALDDNAVEILNVSFAGCEAAQGAAGNLAIYEAWEQAAAQGISVTISSGDSGSANCDDDNTESDAQYGLAVSGLASTPFAIAVGGTDFSVLTSNLPTSFDQYMNASGGTAPYYASLTGYIPESVWNDSSTSASTLDLNVPSSGGDDIVAGGGGVSSCSYQDDNGDCLSGYAKPSFQANLTPPDQVRDVPDVSMFAANGFNLATWAVCGDSVDLQADGTFTDCQLVNGMPTAATTLSGVGGTSAAAPAFAGMLALVSQSTGGRLGNANPTLYQLAATKPADFHDVTIGNNSVSCYSGSPDCGSNDYLIGYNATAGYDTASGLGSVNAANLISDWPSVAHQATSSSLELGKSASSLSASPLQATHGTNLDFSVAISPGASLTGDMTFVTDSDVAALPSSGAPTGYFPVNSGTSSNGVVTGTINSLPGGTYNVYAYYAGDSNYAASKSNPIPVTIGPENSTTALTVSFEDASTGTPLGSKSAPYGSVMYAMAIPQGVNGLDGYPTGTVTFSNDGHTVDTPVSLNATGTASFNNLSQNSLAPGAYQLVGTYSGDKSYNSSMSPAVAFTITPGQVSSQLSASSSAVAYSGSVTLTIDLVTDSIGAQPTGTVTFMSGSTILGTAAMQYGYNANDGTDLGIGTATIPGTVFKKNGINSITAVFAGNADYSSSTSNGVAVYVSGVPTPSIGVSGPASVVLSSPGASASAAITVTPFGGFTGAVNLTCSISGPATSTELPACTSVSATVTGTAAATATIQITTSSSTPSGSYSMTVTGTDAATGKLTSTATIPVTVNASTPAIALAATAVEITGGPGSSAVSTVTVTPSGGFTGPVSLTCSGSGFTCNAASATVTSAGGSAALTINAASTVSPGVYSLTISGVDSTGTVKASTAIQVKVDAIVTPSLSISGTAVTIASPGAAGASTITLTPAGGFTGTITLACTVTAGPTGATSAPTCSGATASITGSAASTVTLNLQTTSTTTAGAYTLAVTATQGSATVATANIAVTVTAAVIPASFTVTGSTVTIASIGSSGSSTITVTPAGGFTGKVNLTCAEASAPAGDSSDASCSLGSQSSVTVSGTGAVTATMTISTSNASTALGTSGKLIPLTGGVALAGVLLWIPAKRRRRFTLVVFFLLSLGGIFAIGCGGGSHSTGTGSSGAGTYTFTVTGKDASTGTIVSSATVTATVE